MGQTPPQRTRTVGAVTSSSHHASLPGPKGGPVPSGRRSTSRHLLARGTHAGRILARPPAPPRNGALTSGACSRITPTPECRAMEAVMTETEFWLGFHLVPGIGATRVARLLEHFGSLAAAWEANVEELRAAGLSERVAGKLVATRRRISLERELERIARAGVSLVTLADPAYPRLLREIPSPPLLLYVRGTLTPADEHSIGIVGTRRASAYGREMTRRLTGDLVRAGLTIVSGLARGIDAVAHRTALEMGGRTIAVLGSGVDVIYPPEHRQLAEQVAQQGALVSE